ncbi:hypothetical protein AKJ09_10856 [Labilithrix luteola]|uniref:Uncharacterized protein n=1 Tax=Labilithrix luteola TaxID=1391654 RepID=A0A0K1QEM9_9BACT|nr:hypothetical protein AKJ09_10856 [Labilithrix luteola]
MPSSVRAFLTAVRLSKGAFQRVIGRTGTSNVLVRGLAVRRNSPAEPAFFRHFWGNPG